MAPDSLTTEEETVARREKKRAASRAYRMEHREYFRAKKKEWDDANKEHKSRYRAAYRATHLETELANGRKWYAANRTRLRASAPDRRQRKLEWLHRWLASLTPEQMAAYRADTRERCRQWQAVNKEKLRAYRVIYYKTHTAKQKAAVARWRSENPIRLSERHKVWRSKNVEHLTVYERQRRRDNPEYFLAKDAVRRSRLSGCGGHITARQLSELFRRQGSRCAMCKGRLTPAWRHADHILPLALGGPNVIGNIQWLCPPCNMSKGARHPIDFAVSRGLLL